MKIKAHANPNLLNILIPYIKIARPDHWFKNVFILPGVVFALFNSPNLLSFVIIPKLLFGLMAICLVTSSNYTINEILDAPYDALHPVKKNRPIPSGQVNLKYAYVLWIFLGINGLWMAWQLNLFFFLSLFALLIMGGIYNIPPIRFKDVPFLDVLSESVNNPIRLFLGWFIINVEYPPTLSLVMAYWMIGAFFMTVKRYAEYQRIGDPKVAESYRKSFSYYEPYNLILCMVYYASAFSLFFGIFIIRYRIELVLCVPHIAGIIPMYMRLAFWEESPAQYPEKLYKEKKLLIYVVCVTVLFITLLFVDIPLVGKIFQPFHVSGSNFI